MTPAARLQAAIDLVDRIAAAARADGAAADTLIARYFATRRYAGSKDRRAVRDLVYRAIRSFGAAPASGRAAMVALARADGELAASFDGSAHGPAALLPDEPAEALSLLPDWIVALLAAPVDAAEQTALLARAPLHVRVNGLKAAPGDLAAIWPEAQPLPGLPHGLALPEGTAIEASDAARDGLVEIQDAGSQWIARACGAEPGMTVLDFCAGAGGKTLALAADMAGKGRLIAADTGRDRLARLQPRAQRAGAAAMIETRLLDPDRETTTLSDLAGACEIVLVDAPCSGSGTWRRNPEARWRLTPERLARTMKLQSRLLALAAPLVRPGGRLVHAVCSLVDGEGRGQAEAFLAAHPGWRAVSFADVGRAHGPGRLLTPGHDGTDGFYFTLLEKQC